MKLSAWIQPIANAPQTLTLPKNAKPSAAQTAGVKTDSFQSNLTTSIKSPTKMRAGNYILNSDTLTKNRTLQETLIKRASQYVIETTQQFTKNILAQHASGDINLQDQTSTIFKLLPELDNVLGVPTLVGSLLVCGNKPAHDVLMDGLKAYPALTQLLAQNFQAQQNRLSNGNVAQLASHFFLESGSLTSSLEIGKPFTEMVDNYQPPFGYKVNPLIPAEGIENGKTVALFQANLVPLVGEANFPNYVDDPIYQKAQSALDKTVYDLAKNSLLAPAITKGPSRSWEER